MQLFPLGLNQTFLQYKLGGEAFGTDWCCLTTLAYMCGVKLGERKDFKNWEEIPDKSILAIHYKEDEDKWHWVVYRKTSNDEFILDSKSKKESGERRDWNRIGKSKWFLPVLSR